MLVSVYVARLYDDNAICHAVSSVALKLQSAVSYFTAITRGIL